MPHPMLPSLWVPARDLIWTPGSPRFWDKGAYASQGLGQDLVQGYYPPTWLSLWCPEMPDQEEVTRLGGRGGATSGCGVASGCEHSSVSSL